jgi:Ca2+-binding EF-hand superfamily protein
MIGSTRVKLQMLLAALLLGTGPAFGQSSDTAPALSTEEAWVINNSSGRMRPGATMTDVREQLNKRFRQADMDASDTITPADLELRLQIMSASSRSGTVNRWMQYDLDADGKVTRDEIATAHAHHTNRPIRIGDSTVAPTPAQRKEATDQHVAKQMVADADGDGVITFEEIFQHAHGIASKQLTGNQYRRESSIPEAFDTNHDGTIDFAEFTAVVSRVLARIDANKNGAFDTAELEAFATLRKAAQAVHNQEQVIERLRQTMIRLAAECAIPKIPDGVTAIHIEADDGGALSNVSLGGEDGVVTLIDIVIEKGETPLYVAASSRGAVIWRVTGATQRIRHFVSSSETRIGYGKGTRTGVSGLDAAVVHLVARHDCFSMTPGRTRRPDVTAQAQPILFEALLGREPDLTVRAPPGHRPRSVARFELPSGALHVKAAYAGARQLPTSGPSAVIWEDILRGRPGGVVDIDPAAVVATAPPQAFEVMPGVAGLAQLVDQGVLEPVEFLPGWRHPDGRVDVGSLMKSKAGTPGAFEAPSAFRIVAPMRMPPGHLSVYGVSPKFILAPGVPMPANLQTGTCVFAEQTRDILSGRGRTNCR